MSSKASADQTPTSYDDVYVWGDIGKRDPKGLFAAPVRLPFQFPSPIKNITSGIDFTLILLQNGKLFGFGNNFYGQLGIPFKRSQSDLSTKFSWVSIPTLIDVLPIGEYVRAVTAGASHAMLLSSSGTVYTTGSNMYFQLGTRKNLSYFDTKEQAISSFGKHTASVVPFRERWEAITSIPHPVRSVATGKWNSYAVTITGAVYSWGTAATGALGHATGDPVDFVKGDIKAFFNRDAEALCSVKLPRRIESLHEKRVHIEKVAAGNDHALLLSEAKEVFSCGAARYGRLGTGKTSPVLEPMEPINDKFPERKHVEQVVDVFAGTDTSFVIRRAETLGSAVYVFGHIANGVGVDTPTLIPELCAVDIVGVASSGTSHVAWTGGGEVYVWGKNANCSSGGIANFYAAKESMTCPVKCGLFEGKTVVTANCGKGSTLVATRANLSGEKPLQGPLCPEREIDQPFVQILHAQQHPNAKDLVLAKHIMQLPNNADAWRIEMLGHDEGMLYNEMFREQVEARYAAEIVNAQKLMKTDCYLSNIGKQKLGARILERGHKVKVWVEDVYALGVILTRVSETPVNGKRVSKFRVRWLREDWVDEELELNSDDEAFDASDSENPNRWLHGWVQERETTQALF